MTKKKQKETKYTLEMLKAALADINAGMSYREAQKLYGISVATLNRHMKGKSKKIERGKPQALSATTEKFIADNLCYLSEIGFGLNKEQIVNMIGEYSEANELKLFKNRNPSDEWFESFMKRNPKLSQRVAGKLQNMRADAMKPDVINEFFDQYENLHKLHHYEAKNIYNADESGCQTCGGKCVIVARKGAKYIKKLTSNNDKQSWTILACCSADGNFIPISLMYKAKNIQSCWRANGPYNAVYNTSDSGWMEKKQFTHWFSQVFIPNANKVDPIGRKLLLLDGHASHISIDLIETARNNSVDLFRLPAHTSHIMQPCDLSLFKKKKKKNKKN